MLIALCGPSGIGKGFIKTRALAQHQGLTELRWLTTRPLRAGENRSGNRISVPRERFEALVSKGTYVLTQELYGNKYALLARQLLDTSRPRVTEIHPENVEEVLRLRPDILLVGFVTEDEALLRERLSVRGDTDCARRLQEAQREMGSIRGQSHLYHQIHTVSRENEESVCDAVLQLIQTTLQSFNQRGSN